MTDLFWFYIVAALVVGLACYIGYLIGREVSDRAWERRLEDERVAAPLAEPWIPLERLSLPEPLHPRMTDPKVYASLSSILVAAAEVIEPVRTEVLPYTPRHSGDGPTVVVARREPLPRRHDDTFWGIVKPLSEPVRLR